MERIHCQGGLEPTLETLNALQFKHLKYIPYENLDIHMSKPIVVEDLNVIKEKVLDRKRGGFCVELNQLFFHLLKSQGFQVVQLLSRVRTGLAPDQYRPQTHIQILVTIGNSRYIADVGGSTNGTPLPICIDNDDVQVMAGEHHRVLATGERDFLHQYMHDDGTWCDIKVFHVENIAQVADCEAINWFSCTHRDSRHINNAILTIQTDTGIKTLQNDELGLRQGNSKSVKRTIATFEEYLTILEKDFLLPVSEFATLKVPQTVWNIVK